MQLEDIVTLINDLKQEVEVTVIKLYQSKDEGTGKPSLLADLKETATGREHLFVPSKDFVKGARQIFYYLDRKPMLPKPKQDPVPQPEEQPTEQKPTPADVAPEQQTDAKPDPLAVTEDVPVTTTKKPGQNKTIKVSDAVVAKDK